MNTQDEINFLKKLLDDYLEHFNAEEQNCLINLIQKLMLIRDKDTKEGNTK